LEICQGHLIICLSVKGCVSVCQSSLNEQKLIRHPRFNITLMSFWPDPSAIRSVFEKLNLRSSRLYHTVYSLGNPDDVPPDTTIVYLTDNDEIVAIDDSKYVQRSSYDSVSEQLPTEFEPFLRIPVAEIDQEIDRDEIPTDWTLTSKPFMDEYLDITVAATEPSEELLWKTQEQMRQQISEDGC
ncbi:MAG: hypothetical protein ABEI86_01060, partial [Halobacteriaceae archaeon]